MDCVSLALGLAVFLLAALFWRKKGQRAENEEKLDRLGGPKRYPIIGTVYEFMKCTREDLYEASCLRNKKYGPIFRTYIGSQPFVHVMKAQHAEIILKSQVHLRKGAVYNSVKPWLGDGLISTGSVDIWRSHRRLLTPSFHFKILDAFTEVFIEKSQLLVEQLEELATGDFFNIYPYAVNCTLDIICETAMGVKINAMYSTNTEYVKATLGMSELVLKRLFNPLVNNYFIYSLTANGRKYTKYLEILHGFTNKVIQDRTREVLARKRHDSMSEEDYLLGKKKRLAFLDLLIETNRHERVLTDKEIQEEVDTFMFAGHDTTAAASAWTIYAIANHPEVQKKVHEELDSIFQGEDRPITIDDINQMKYLEMVIKETMRFYTIVPVIGRSLEEEIEIDGRPVPPGVMVIIHLRDLHKDPAQFPNPDRFDPENFLPERSAKRHPFAFIPFSAGPRNCLGQKFAYRSSRTLVASILRKFKVKALHKHEEMRYYGEIVLKPQQGIHVALEKR